MNRSKSKGTAAESAVRDYLLARGITAVRAALAGAEDRGDVHAYPTAHGYRLVIEVKVGTNSEPDHDTNPTVAVRGHHRSCTGSRRRRRRPRTETPRQREARGLARLGHRRHRRVLANAGAGGRQVVERRLPAFVVAVVGAVVCLPFGELIDHLGVLL